MANTTPSLPTVPELGRMPELSPEDAAKVAAILSDFTLKQQGFIRAVVAGNTPAVAAKQAGYKGIGKLTAKRLMSDPALVKAIEDVRIVFANRALFDFEDAHNTLMAALHFARQTSNATAAVRAVELLAKLHGHLTDKLDVNAKGDILFSFPPFTPQPKPEAQPEPLLIEPPHAE